MGLSKLINKVNKAKSAINSLKGISSKIQSLNYTSQIDRLGEEAEQAQNFLNEARKRDSKMLSAISKSQSLAKNRPQGADVELRYPLTEMENSIVFTIRPRRKRTGETGKNLFSDGPTEIELYIPEGVTTEADVTYGTQEVSRFGRAVTQSEGIGEMVAEGVAVVKDLGTKLAGKVTGGATNIREGRAANPMIEANFEGVSFRSYSFNYEFWPKNAAEAAEVGRIIHTFRSAMLPDTYGTGGEGSSANIENYFNFPNIFDVEYHGPVREHLDGFLPMVCEGVSVDHFNGNHIATFENGQPISTSMTLKFTEIKILSQESYQEISPFGISIGGGMDSMVETEQNAATADATGDDG